MKLSPVAFAVAAASIWGAAILVIGTVNAMVPGYGEAVLALVVSLYPGYDASGEFGDLMLGTFYAVVDGLAAGAVFALIYNAVVRCTGEDPPQPATADAVQQAADDSTADAVQQSADDSTD